MNESDSKEDRTLRKPSQAGDASTLRKPAADPLPSPKLTIEQARNQYLSLKRVLLLVVLFFVIWYVLPRTFSWEIDRQQENPGSTAIEVSGELPTLIQVHLREGIIRTRGAWATHPILSVFTYVLLHGNAVSVCVALIMLRSGTAPARDRVGSASLMGLVSGVLLWTAFWGYDQWGWYVLVFIANGWFVLGMSRNTEFGEDRPLSSGMTRNKRSETASVSSSAKVPSNVMPILGQAEQASRQQRWAEAVLAYEKAFERHEPMAEALCQYGLCLNNLGQFEKAEAAFRSSIKVNPGFANAYANLGVLLVRDLGRPRDAEEMFLEALKIDPSHGARENLDTLRRRYRKAESSAIKNYLCDSCGHAFTNIGASNGTAIGGARCRHCGTFYCEPCVSHHMKSSAVQTFTCACGNATLTQGGEFNNFDEKVLFRQ